jgi:exonuclease III
MRLATWNCQTGLDSNWEFVDELDADVLTIQECGDKTQEQARERGWSCSWLHGWVKKGLAVLARPPYVIASAQSPEPYFISAEVSGPERFRFVALWAMDRRYTGLEYVQQGTRLIDWLRMDGTPTIVAGDFNASKSPGHLSNVEQLKKHGLVSAYHRFHRVRHEDAEEQPTSFWRWSHDHPFHMDFVFVPVEWTVEDVAVGNYEDYLAPPRRLSDHVPVVVTLRPTR